MRKSKYYLIVFIIIVIGTGMYFLKSNISQSITASTVTLEPISKNISGINMMVDPRIELLAAVQTISGYEEKFDLLTNLNFTYKNDMKNYFSKLSNHEAVKTFDVMSITAFSYDAPPTAMLYLSNPLNLKVKQDFEGLYCSYSSY